MVAGAPCTAYKGGNSQMVRGKNEPGCIREPGYFIEAQGCMNRRFSLISGNGSEDFFDEGSDAGHQLVVKPFGFVVLIGLHREPDKRLGP
jgi:hypothetical protein